MKKDRICIICGKEFTPSTNSNKLCSKECKMIQKKKLKEKYKKEPSEKECVICGKIFETTADRIICCSKECTKENKRKYYWKNKKSEEKVSTKIIPTEKQISHIKELIYQGKTQKEISNITGFSKNVLTRCAKENEFSFNGFNTGNKDKEEYFIQKFESIYPNYRYISGYDGCDNKFIMKCKICGHIQEKNAHCIRGKQKKHSTLKCDNCTKIENEVIKQQKLKEEEQSRVIKEYKDKLIKYNKLINKELDLISRTVEKECKICGKKFTTTNMKLKCCSKECSKKNINKNKDKRIYKNGKADSTITLTKLNKRDKGICHICGQKCDNKDFYYTEEGYFIAGDNYPSIDHVMPIAKGGLHQWENVKLAHRKCNSEKRDSTIYETSNKQLKLSI